MKKSEHFNKYASNVTVIDNECHITLKGCKPRPIFRDRLHEQCYYLKKDRKTKEPIKIYLGY